MMTVLFDARYEDGWLPLVILALGQLVNVGTGSIGDLLVMTGHQKNWFKISGTMLVVNIALNCLFVPRWGLAGAAFGTACALGGMFFLGLLRVRHLLRIWPYDRRYFKGFLAILTAAAAMMLWRLLQVTSPALNLFVSLAIAIGVFGGTLLLLGLDKEDKEFIQLMRARLKL
jgi:O-antigen/teichoic acid export membrane protein